MITCPNRILVHFAIVQISDFGPISIRSKNLDQYSNYWKVNKIGFGLVIIKNEAQFIFFDNLGTHWPIFWVDFGVKKNDK